MTTEETQQEPEIISTSTNTNKKQKTTKDDQQELDLVDLNPDTVETTDDGALKQESEEAFDPDEYGGFPLEAWNKFFGAINDKRQARSASLSKLSVYTVRVNSSNDPYFPKFQITTLKYSPITKKAWEVRRSENAEIEDMQRELQTLNQRLAENQESLRLRIFARNKPRGMVTNREDPIGAQLDEIQGNLKFLANFQTDIGRKISEKQQQSDLAAFQMYFHKGKEVYEQIMNEDLDDILRACDFKQIYGSANLRLSKPSSLPAASQGIS